MTPYYVDDWLTVYLGDCRAVMAEMEPESVHCVVTSPPYWGLRDYGTEGQLGLEPTPEAYVESMVAVFREVRRVLRSDGTVWLNLGDSYASSPPGNGKGFTPETTGLHGGRTSARYQATMDAGSGTKRNTIVPGLKPKDLVGIPWRVAFALQADGWYLRSDIIWAKPNPMPESVTDRPTKAHEYLFLLSKSPRYYFDADAVREPHAPGSVEHQRYSRAGNHEGGRNIRSVWNIATQPYPGAHFATFPPKLVEPCIKAGTSERGVCPECGAPWVRILGERPYPKDLANAKKAHGGVGNNLGGQQHQDWLTEHPRETVDWWPSCEHGSKPYRAPGPVPATVLDPFAGSGTTAMVAQSLSRRAVLIDLNADYLGQVMDRNRDIPLGLGA